MEAYTTEKIPTWVINYMWNGDATDLEDEEVNMIEDFLSKIEYKDFENEDDDPQPYFTHYPAFGKPCEVIDVTFYK